MASQKKSYLEFHRRLHGWYATHGRQHLPWRNTSDPYAIYLSEVMLQQTQVRTVLERFYYPFLERFPTLRDVADAPRDAILSQWQGLGYYTRAINLQKAAQQCGGTLPSSVEALMALPGIGRNTAHAIAAFAFKQPAPVMEANVKRVLSRMFALEMPSDQQLWEHAHSLLDHEHPFDYNQAMMDVGSLVCTRRAPKCRECPANHLCAGRHSPERYPAAKIKKSVPVRSMHIVVLYNLRGEFYATIRQEKFLHGLYRFVELPQRDPPARTDHLGTIRQQYSHFTLEAEVWSQQQEYTGPDWYPFARLETLPMSMAEKKIIELIRNAFF